MERALGGVEAPYGLKMYFELTPRAVPLRSEEPELNAPLKITLAPEPLRCALPRPLNTQRSPALPLLNLWRRICGRREAVSERLRGEKRGYLYPPE